MLERIEDYINHDELEICEYYTLKTSIRELITTISWSLYHHNNSELYVSRTFIDLINNNLKRYEEGGE